MLIHKKQIFTGKCDEITVSAKWQRLP